MTVDSRTAVLLLVLALFGVSHCARSGDELQEDCPYNAINGADNLAWLNLTHVDILYGTVLENKTIADVRALCKSNKLSQTVADLRTYIRSCDSSASPTLPAFNIDGFQAALTYLCEEENIKILERNVDCFKENLGSLSQCRSQRKKEAAVVDKDDALAKACSMQRTHEYCSDKVLRANCKKELADLKVTMANKVTAPYCNCDETVKRQDASDCFSPFCLEVAGKNMKERDMYDSLLFGAEDVDDIHDTCKSSKSGRDYVLTEGIKKCGKAGCKWWKQFYKWQLYSKDGVVKSADYFCESQNYLFEKKDCIKENFAKFKDCVRKGCDAVDTKLREDEEQDNMNKVTCQKREVTNDCIRSHFGSCGSKVRDCLETSWDLRGPRICDDKCKPIGYGGSAGVTSSLSLVLGILMAAMSLARL